VCRIFEDCGIETRHNENFIIFFIDPYQQNGVFYDEETDQSLFGCINYLGIDKNLFQLPDKTFGRGRK
jgi:hypothetical protein